MKTILIIGAGGFLGKVLTEYFSKNYKVISAGINTRDGLLKLDATNKSNVEAFLSHHKPDVVIDTVALSSSVACEKDPELCLKMNYFTAKNIVEACKKNHARVVFISSSYVFDGKKGNYSESDQPNPTNEYAKAKIMAEKDVLKVNGSSVIRVDMMYGVENGKLKCATKIIDENATIELGYPDQIRSPIFIDDVPVIIDAVIKKNETGIFNAGGNEKITSLDFFKKISKILSKAPKIKIVDPSGWIVKSPSNSSLDMSKVNKLGINLTKIDKAVKIIKENLD